jgi:hypothetical protein
MESEYPESWSRHTPKGMNVVSETTKSTKYQNQKETLKPKNKKIKKTKNKKQSFLL